MDTVPSEWPDVDWGAAGRYDLADERGSTHSIRQIRSSRTRCQRHERASLPGATLGRLGTDGVRQHQRLSGDDAFTVEGQRRRPIQLIALVEKAADAGAEFSIIGSGDKAVAERPREI